MESMRRRVPVEADGIAKAASETAGILTVEEHGIGGLGTMAAEVLASIRAAVPFHPLRLGRDPIRLAGSQEELRSTQGLSVEGILAVAKRLLDPELQAHSAQTRVS